MGHSPNQQTQNLTVSKNGGVGGVTLFTTSTPHTFFSNQPIWLGGTPPSGFSSSTNYYVVSAGGNLTTTTFALAAAPSGAAITATDNGTSVTATMPTGTFRVVRLRKQISEQWLTGQANASAAKVSAAEGGATSAEKFWQSRRVKQFIGTPNEDEFEYVVSAQDDGT